MHKDIDVQQSEKIRKLPAIVHGCLPKLTRIFLRNLTLRFVIGADDTNINSVLLELPEDFRGNS
jgi:hypothetical protein